MKLRPTFILISALSLLFLLSSCAHKPDEFDNYQARRLEKMALSVMTVQGTILDVNGQGVSNLNVTVSSPRYSQDARTANDGYFSAQAKFSPDDSLDFHFSGPNVDWTASLVRIPRGVDTLRPKFLLEKSGKIRLAAVEY